MVLSIQSIPRWTDSFASKQTKPKGCPPVGAALSLLGHGIVEPGHDGRLDALEKVPDGMVSEDVSLLHGLVAVHPVGPVRSALLGEPRGVAKQGVSLSNVDLAMRREARWGNHARTRSLTSPPAESKRGTDGTQEARFPLPLSKTAGRSKSERRRDWGVRKTFAQRVGPWKEGEVSAARSSGRWAVAPGLRNRVRPRAREGCAREGG